MTEKQTLAALLRLAKQAEKARSALAAAYATCEKVYTADDNVDDLLSNALAGAAQAVREVTADLKRRST